MPTRIISGFDKDGRPIIYMRPGRENTETGPRQLRHLVWCLCVARACVALRLTDCTS